MQDGLAQLLVVVVGQSAAAEHFQGELFHFGVGVGALLGFGLAGATGEDQCHYGERKSVCVLHGCPRGGVGECAQATNARGGGKIIRADNDYFVNRKYRDCEGLLRGLTFTP
ncbi:hypothetical protein D3C72_1875820 [compost metagenome]